MLPWHAKRTDDVFGGHLAARGWTAVPIQTAVQRTQEVRKLSGDQGTESADDSPRAAIECARHSIHVSACYKSAAGFDGLDPSLVVQLIQGDRSAWLL
jgi:hypothetical protein